jgi:hypothetical protein
MIENLNTWFWLNQCFCEMNSHLSWSAFWKCRVPALIRQQRVEVSWNYFLHHLIVWIVNEDVPEDCSSGFQSEVLLRCYSILSWLICLKLCLNLKCTKVQYVESGFRPAAFTMYFLLFLGSSAAPNLPLLFHFVPTAATISCPWSAGQVAAAASPGTAVLSAAFFCSVRGAVLSLLCRLEFTALTTAQLCFVLRFLVTNTFYFLAVAPAISVL